MKSTIVLGAIALSTLVMSPAFGETFCLMPMSDKMDTLIKSKFTIQNTWSFKGSEEDKKLEVFSLFEETDAEDDGTKLTILIDTFIDTEAGKATKQCVASMGYTSDKIKEGAKQAFRSKSPDAPSDETAPKKDGVPKFEALPDSE